MDRPVDIKDWRPTLEEADHLDWDDNTIRHLFGELALDTRRIQRNPYNPGHWTERARVLEVLGYPELAVGDAHKGRMLSQMHLRILDERWHGLHAKKVKVVLGHAMRFGIIVPPDEDEENLDRLIPGLSNSRKNAITGLQKYLEEVADEAVRLMTNNLYYMPSYREGRFVRRQYPWMDPDYRIRSDELLARIQDELDTNPGSKHGKGPACTIRRDAFGSHNSDILGMFASRNIKKDEVLVVDFTDTFGCSSPKGPAFPGSRLAAADFDPVPENLRWIRERAEHNPTDVLLLSCFLRHTRRGTPNAHPLKHHLIARLTPCYGGKARKFSLLNDIDIVNETLVRCGIDIFADSRYDTWVLWTIQARIDNNSWSNPTSTSVNKLFSLFNHSCEPNVSWNTELHDHTIMMRAARDVKEGEQLFVEYDQFLSDRPLKERRKRLVRWLNGPCHCNRCKRDEAEELVKTNTNGDPVPNWDVESHPRLPEQKGVEVFKS